MKKNNEELKTQSLGFIATFIIEQVFKSIIGFITLWLFKPVWNWFFGLWSKKEDEVN